MSLSGKDVEMNERRVFSEIFFRFILIMFPNNNLPFSVCSIKSNTEIRINL